MLAFCKYRGGLGYAAPVAKKRTERRSECPISCSLDILGDRWTLLVLRDLLDGKRRFSELERSPEGIPTNVLADRLRRLTTTGIVSRTPNPATGRHEYEPTEMGWALRPVLLELAAWGNGHLADTWHPPDQYLGPPDPAA